MGGKGELGTSWGMKGAAQTDNIGFFFTWALLKVHMEVERWWCKVFGLHNHAHTHHLP